MRVGQETACRSEEPPLPRIVREREESSAQVRRGNPYCYRSALGVYSPLAVVHNDKIKSVARLTTSKHWRTCKGFSPIYKRTFQASFAPTVFTSPQSPRCCYIPTIARFAFLPVALALPSTKKRSNGAL